MVLFRTLISFTLSRNHFPPEIQSYINCLYSQLSATVTSASWTSESFVMSHGVFQGDPLSPLIFICCFNSLLNFPKVLKRPRNNAGPATLILTVCTPNPPLQSPPLHGQPTLLSCPVRYSKETPLPLIFILSSNPLLDFLKTNSQHTTSMALLLSRFPMLMTSTS